MKVSIYRDVPVEDKEREFLLKLEKVGDCIYLKLVTEDGTMVNQGSLLRINPDMTVSRCTNISKNLGLILNVNGELIIREEDD